MRPTHGKSDQLVAGDWADVTFRITDAISGTPLQGSYPAAWMDLTEGWQAKGDRIMSCKDWVVTYLQGNVGVRPMIDLNSHFLLVMNRDASISVIDPTVGITGITNLFAQINLDKPGADWAKTWDEKRLFVSMPPADQVALIDTDTFKVVERYGGRQATHPRRAAGRRALPLGRQQCPQGRGERCDRHRRGRSSSGWHSFRPARAITRSPFPTATAMPSSATGTTARCRSSTCRP